MIKVGIAGIRGISTLMGFRECPDVEVRAICDLDEEILRATQEEYGIPNGYRVFDDMLDSDIDAVVIATPMPCHVPQALAALEAGKHVMSEVTAGVTMDELYWLCEAVEKSGRTYMMAENFCYTPENQLVLSLVRKGFFGEVYYGECEYLHNLISLLRYNYDAHHSGKLTWRNYWQLGRRGTFYPTHSLGPMCQWFGNEPIREIATFSSGNHVSTDLAQDDTCVTMCKTESGKLIKLRIDCKSNRPHNMMGYQLQGTKGVFEASRGMGDQAKVWFTSLGEHVNDATWRPLTDFAEHLPERYQRATEAQKRTAHSGGDFFVVQDFVNAIQTGQPPEIDVYRACEWTAVGLLSAQSVEEHSRILAVPDFRRNARKR